MKKLIKTENARKFISDYFMVDHQLSDIHRMANVTIANDILANEVIISNESGLKDGEYVIIEMEQSLNRRCDITHAYIYSIVVHDSVSVKGILQNYSIEPTYNK